MNYELRALSLAEILDAAFRLVQTEWRTLIGLSLLMQIPIVLLGSQVSWILDPFAQPFASGEDPSPEMLMQGGLVAAGMGLAYLILYPFVAGAVTAAVGNFYLGRQFTLAEAVRAGLGSLLKLVFAYFIYVVVLAIGAFVVGWVVVWLGPTVIAGLALLGTAGSVVQFAGGFALFCFFFY